VGPARVGSASRTFGVGRGDGVARRAQLRIPGPLPTGRGHESLPLRLHGLHVAIDAHPIHPKLVTLFCVNGCRQLVKGNVDVSRSGNGFGLAECRLMASLQTINYVPRHPEVVDGRIKWLQGASKSPIALPQICWDDGTTWGEANLWALTQATSQKKDIETVSRSMSHLTAYAKWLESEHIDWWHFPPRESERCLILFRGALVRARDRGELAPSTASQRMAAVVRFYRWVRSTHLLSTEWPMWEERQVGVRLKDAFGFEHTLRVSTTDLSIPNRKVAGGITLEDGLLPVSVAAMNEILQFAEQEASEELWLMLLLGFRSGLRVGSITDLKVQTLENASIDPVIGWHRLALGPGARPPVATKLGVSGMVPVLDDVLERALAYSTSTRRLKRQALAAKEHRELLFLTRFGTPYGSDESRAINVEMSRLRTAGRNAGVRALHDFHFHRSRATFATELMRAALGCMPVADAIDFVREACLHRDEATTLRYVKFLERSKAMAQAADAFTQEFLGLAKGHGGIGASLSH